MCLETGRLKGTAHSIVLLTAGIVIVSKRGVRAGNGMARTLLQRSGKGSSAPGDEI